MARHGYENVTNGNPNGTNSAAKPPKPIIFFCQFVLFHFGILSILFILSRSAAEVAIEAFVLTA